MAGSSVSPKKTRELGDEGAAHAGNAAGQRKFVNAAEIDADRGKNWNVKDGLEIVTKFGAIFGFECDAAVADIEDADFGFCADGAERGRVCG